MLQKITLNNIRRKWKSGAQNDPTVGQQPNPAVWNHPRSQQYPKPSQRFDCIQLIFFRWWGQLATHHVIVFCCDWLVFNTCDWCPLYSPGWITKALFTKHFSHVLTHYYAEAGPVGCIFMLQNVLISELVLDILHWWVWLIWWVAVVPSYKNKPSLCDGIPYLVKEKNCLCTVKTRV